MHHVVTQIEERIKSTFVFAPKIPYIVDEAVETEGLRECIEWWVKWEGTLERKLGPFCQQLLIPLLHMLPRAQPLRLITLDSSSGFASSPRAAFRAPVEYSSTLLRLGQLGDGRCDDHLPCCQSDEDSNAKRVVNLMGRWWVKSLYRRLD